MATPPNPFPQSHSGFWHSRYRFICKQVKQTNRPIHIVDTRPLCNCYWRFQCQLESIFKCFCLPTFQSYGTSSKQGCDGPGHFSSDSTGMAVAGMVLSSLPSVYHAAKATSPQQHPTAARPSTAAPNGPQPASSGLQTLREALCHQGIPTNAQKLVIESWRNSTRKSYAPYIKSWTTFCRQQNITIFSPSINDVLTFLSNLHDEGKSFSTLNTARSALSALITVDGQPVGQHPLVKRLLRGAFNIRPSLPRYRQFWDVKLLLQSLSSSADIRVKDLLSLSCHMVTLLAVLSAKRCQSLHSMDIRHIAVYDNHLRISFQNKLKQTRPGRHDSDIVIKSYPQDSQLCALTVCGNILSKHNR